MPNRPVFALFIIALLGFPVALLAQQGVQTQKFNNPLISGWHFPRYLRLACLRDPGGPLFGQWQ